MEIVTSYTGNCNGMSAFGTTTSTWTTTQIVEYTYDCNNVWIRKLLDTDSNGTFDAKTIFIPENYETAVQLDDANLSDATAPTITHRYLWTPGTQDKLLADSTSDGVLWTLTDHLGTIRDIIQQTSTGLVTPAHIIYDAYGNVISCKDSSGNNISNPILFGYTGKAFDVSTQLQNNINRWYDPTVGRWLTTDPIGFNGNDTNLYRYLDNNPKNYVDFWGLKKKKNRSNYQLNIPRDAKTELQNLIRALNENQKALQFFINLIESDYCKEHTLSFPREEGGKCKSKETSGYILKANTANQYKIWEYRKSSNTVDSFEPYLSDEKVPTYLPKIPDIPKSRKLSSQNPPFTDTSLDENYHVVLMWHTHPCGDRHPSDADWDLVNQNSADLLHLVLSKQGMNYVFYFYYTHAILKFSFRLRQDGTFHLSACAVLNGNVFGGGRSFCILA